MISFQIEITIMEENNAVSSYMESRVYSADQAGDAAASEAEI